MWIYKRGRNWWVKYGVEGRYFFESLKTRDRRAAEFKAAEIVKAAELRAAGVETYIKTSKSEPETLIGEYKAELERRGRTAAHVQPVVARLKAMTDGAHALADLTPEWIRRRLAQDSERQGVKPRTSNRYRLALFGFFRWMCREGRWSGNPVETVGTAREGDPEPRDSRRSLSPEELARLLAAAPRGRANVYLLAATSGLRRKELGSLRWADIDLQEGTVRVRAASAKNRRESVVPLPSHTVEVLRAMAHSLDPEAPVFRSVPKVCTLRKDLLAAGIDPQTEEGKLDLHALRVTYGTSLSRADVSLAQAQRLLRHSTPTLTARIYTRLELHDARGAARKLGVLLDSARKEATTGEETGT